MLINNKEKQAVGGNWGHPRPFIKSQTKVVPPKDNDEVQYKKVKRNKKKKKPYIYPGHCCPFCNKELPIDDVVNNTWHNSSIY